MGGLGGEVVPRNGWFDVADVLAQVDVAEY